MRLAPRVLFSGAVVALVGCGTTTVRREETKTVHHRLAAPRLDADRAELVAQREGDVVSLRFASPAPCLVATDLETRREVWASRRPGGVGRAVEWGILGTGVAALAVGAASGSAGCPSGGEPVSSERTRTVGTCGTFQFLLGFGLTAVGGVALVVDEQRTGTWSESKTLAHERVTEPARCAPGTTALLQLGDGREEKLDVDGALRVAAPPGGELRVRVEGGPERVVRVP